MNTLGINYDPATDVVVIEGVEYAAELFRCLGIAPVGSWLRIVERQDTGVIAVYTPAQHMHWLLDCVSGYRAPRATKDDNELPRS